MLLHECCESLHGDLSGGAMKGFDGMLDDILKAKPIAWLPLLKNIDTVFLALEYQDKESLPVAYEKFKSANTAEDFAKSGLGDVLQCVQKIFRQPILQTRGLDVLEESLDLHKLVKATVVPMLEEVIWRTATSETKFTQKDWELVLEIVTCQLENMRRRMKVFLQPHHTQTTTLLMFAFLVCAAQQGNTDTCKTVLAEMGTGEGKSWVIAMLAAFVAKKGMRAHVLVDNNALLQRDCSVMKDFFASLGITMAIADKTEDSLTDPSCRVVYSSAWNIDRAARNCAMRGDEPDAEQAGEAILIVDEVDGLVLDTVPYVHWLHEDTSTVEEFKSWVKARSNRVRVSGLTECCETGNGVYSRAGSFANRTFFKHESAVLFVYCLEEERWCLSPVLGSSENMWAEKTSSGNSSLPCSGPWDVLTGSTGHPVVKVGTLDAIEVSCMEEYTRRTFENFQTACYEAETKVQGIHYQAFGKQLYLLDSVTKIPKPHSTDMWLEVLRSELDPEYVFSFKAVQTVISKVLSHQTYSRIFGLTGSVGGVAERDFLKTHYGAVVFQVPSFLDTCPDTRGKQRPTLQGSEHILQSSEEAQIERVVQLAAEYSSRVPVLVLVANPRMRERMVAELRVSTDVPEEYTSRPDHGIVEIKCDENGNDDLARKVELATKPVTTTRDGKRSKRWPIAVTTAEGGRGHDYRIMDAGVDKQGGLCVIITWIPDSVRDWTQFKGRTARQDNKGQYVVVLNMEKEMHEIDAGSLRGAKAEDIVNILMDAMTVKTAAQLSGFSQVIPKANLMQQLSVKFWQLGDGNALSKIQERQWIHLCEIYRKMSEESIEEHWRAHVLPRTTEMRSTTSRSSVASRTSVVKRVEAPIARAFECAH
mmetsp:Transcript_105736/g.337770  ORF Transcript_105736/g.337770 Transcript_105736/m.337770 type:complete len:872 (+) Transcript_105736:792-3407(+)